MTEPYARDMTGYGRNAPDPQMAGWRAHRVQFVVNYEEGGENNILHGDAASEAFLSEIVGAAAWPGQRHWNMESIYEYGARAGFWRLWRMFTSRKVPVTVYGVATALQRSPEQTAAMKEAGWEIAIATGSNGSNTRTCRRTRSACTCARPSASIPRSPASAPLGWYLGRCSMNTTKLVMEEGGFAYSSDSYADDLPYWVNGPARWAAARTSSSPTRSTATTCASPRRRGSTPATSSSPT